MATTTDSASKINNAPAAPTNIMNILFTGRWGAYCCCSLTDEDTSGNGEKDVWECPSLNKEIS